MKIIISEMKQYTNNLDTVKKRFMNLKIIAIEIIWDEREKKIKKIKSTQWAVGCLQAV